MCPLSSMAHVQHTLQKRVVLKAGMPETQNAGNQDPEILKPGMTFREGKRAK